MKTVAIIQARMGSTRLPGKVLMPLDGQPLLGLLVSRVREASSLDEVVVATSTLPQDDPIYDFCEEAQIACFRGDESDVLDRYVQCAKHFQADTIVRLTADCPLLDPIIVDQVVECFYQHNADYCGNTVPPETSTFPDGSDVEVFSMRALLRAHCESTDAQDREHVTFYFWKEVRGFNCVQLQNEQDWSGYRITVDYPEDLDVIKAILVVLSQKGLKGSLQEVVQILDEHPETKALNANHFFGEGWSA